VLAVALLVFLTVPLAMILVRSVEGRAASSSNRQFRAVRAVTGARTVDLEHADLRVPDDAGHHTFAFLFAYAMRRSCVPFRGLFRNIAMIRSSRHRCSQRSRSSTCSEIRAR
jgi:hypothetical protein